MEIPQGQAKTRSLRVSALVRVPHREQRRGGSLGRGGGRFLHRGFLRRGSATWMKRTTDRSPRCAHRASHHSDRGGIRQRRPAERASRRCLNIFARFRVLPVVAEGQRAVEDFLDENTETEPGLPAVAERFDKANVVVEPGGWSLVLKRRKGIVNSNTIAKPA